MVIIMLSKRQRYNRARYHYMKGVEAIFEGYHVYLRDAEIKSACDSLALKIEKRYNVEIEHEGENLRIITQ